MRVYTVTNEFDLTLLNMTVTVGTTIGKYDGQILSLIGSTEWSDPAFYDWVGSPDSLNFMSFTGVVPDPVAGDGVPRTPVATPATPTSAGTQGTWAYDGTYLYWCVATDTWVRWVLVTSW